jgi:ABC-2 type transport system permease protein
MRAWSFRRSWAVCQHDLRILRRDPLPLFVLVSMPLILMGFLQPAFRAALVEHGQPAANGAEQAVPGMAVMFSMFLVSNVGFAFFREHGWNTWERLRASPAKPGEIMLGKAVGPLLVAGFQLVALFGAGGLVYGLHVRGSILAMGLTAAAFAVCMVSLGLAVVVSCRTLLQVNALSNVGALVLAGVGGALTPSFLMPHWVRTIAPGAPSYWAMRGFRAVILSGAGIGDVVVPVGVLVLFSAALAAFASARFRMEQTKVAWA